MGKRRGSNYLCYFMELISNRALRPDAAFSSWNLKGMYGAPEGQLQQQSLFSNKAPRTQYFPFWGKLEIKNQSLFFSNMVAFSLLAFLGSASPAAPLNPTYTGDYTLDPSWPADLSKIGPMNGTSGVAVDAMAGEVYLCQQRGSPRVTVWDSKSGALKRSWYVTHIAPISSLSPTSPIEPLH